VKRTAQIAFLIVTIVANPVSAQTDTAPKVDALLAGTRKFFDQWNSVQWSRSVTQVYMDPTTGEWIEHGVESLQEAWNPERWHARRKTMYSWWRDANERRASGYEQIGVDNTVLSASWEFRDPTAEEIAAMDQSWMETDNAAVLRRTSILWYDGEAGVNAFSRSHPGEHRLLNGKFSLGSSSEEFSILSDFEPSSGCRVEPMTILERPCWRILNPSRPNGGQVTITICPELGFAPVEYTLSLSANDQYAKGLRVGDGKDHDGNDKLTSETRITLESLKDDWTTFTIRELIWGKYNNGKYVGFGKVIEHSDVVRPATDEALRMQYVIPDGTKVTLMNSQQLQAEWRDGKVVRVYEGQAIKELATVQMAAPQPSRWRWYLVAACLSGTAGGCWWLWKKRQSQGTTTGVKNRR